jgi:4-oxalocrotonate tautomerase
MPEIYVYAAAGRSTDQKRSVAREITESIVRHFAVPAEFVVVQFVEAARDSKARGGVLFSEQGTVPPVGTSAPVKS